MKTTKLMKLNYCVQIDCKSSPWLQSMFWLNNISQSFSISYLCESFSSE